MGHRTIAYLGAIYTLIITVALLSPVGGDPFFTFPYQDKVIHIGIHWLLTGIWSVYFLRADRNHIFFPKALIVLILCFFYGILIEALQHWFTETRTFDLLDILANGIGDLLGIISFYFIRKKRIH